MKALNSTGIKLKFDPGHGWVATVEFSTWEHASPACIEGSIGTRYFERELSTVIDRAMEAAHAIGVSFQSRPELQPTIYVEGDGEDSEVPLPSNWRELVARQCERLGWKTCYDEFPAQTCDAPDRLQ